MFYQSDFKVECVTTDTFEFDSRSCEGNWMQLTAIKIDILNSILLNDEIGIVCLFDKSFFN